MAVKWRYISYNPATVVETPRIEKYHAQTLTPAQARQFLKALAGHRLELLFRLALTIGLRRGELLALQWSDFDAGKQTIRVSGSLQRIAGQLRRVEPKTESSARTIELPATLSRALEQHQARQRAEGYQSDYIFTSDANTPLEPGNVYRTFKALLRHAKLPTTLRLHDLRHGCATLLVAEGVHLNVIKDILGHTQISTTADVYGHTLADMQRDALDKLNNILEED